MQVKSYSQFPPVADSEGLQRSMSKVEALASRLGWVPGGTSSFTEPSPFFGRHQTKKRKLKKLSNKSRKLNRRK